MYHFIIERGLYQGAVRQGQYGHQREEVRILCFCF